MSALSNQAPGTTDPTDPYYDDISKSYDDYSYYTGQIPQADATVQAWSQMLQQVSHSNSLQGYVLAVYAFMEMLNRNELNLAYIGSSMDIMGNSTSLVGACTDEFAKGGDITQADSQQYLQYLQDLYNAIKGKDGVNGGQPIIPLSADNQAKALGYIANIANAYGNKLGHKVDGNPNNLTADDILESQKQWQVDSTGSDAKENPDFTTVNSSYGSLSKFFSAQNSALQTQQQGYQSIDTNLQQGMKNMGDGVTALLRDMTTNQKTSASG